jgi:hypothetical protein
MLFRSTGLQGCSAMTPAMKYGYDVWKFGCQEPLGYLKQLGHECVIWLSVLWKLSWNLGCLEANGNSWLLDEMLAPLGVMPAVGLVFFICGMDFWITIVNSHGVIIDLLQTKIKIWSRCLVLAALFESISSESFKSNKVWWSTKTPSRTVSFICRKFRVFTWIEVCYVMKWSFLHVGHW